MAVHVHCSVQDADDFEAVIALAEIEHVPSHKVFQVTRPDINGSALMATDSQRTAGITNVIDITLGLIHAPLFGGIAPDIGQIGFRLRQESQ